MWDALSDERMGVSFTIAAGLGSESRGNHDHILLSQVRDSPNLEDQVPVFISLRRMVAHYTLRHWISSSLGRTNCLQGSSLARIT
jgi:hypothetical protein